MNASLLSLERSLNPNSLVQVTVPSLDVDTNPIPERQARGMVEDIFLEACGGATALKGEGVWRNGDAPAVREVVSIVFGHLPDHFSDTARQRFVFRLAAFAVWARQQALLVVVDNKAFFIPGINATGGALATG